MSNEAEGKEALTTILKVCKIFVFNNINSVNQQDLGY